MPLHSETMRRKAVAFAIALTDGTFLAPKRYERQLMGQYQQGELSIDEVIALLEASIYHVAYRSQTTSSPSEASLQGLLSWSRQHNTIHQLTGLLLYSDGRYVQVIEGAEADVRALFTRIQRDARHQHVVTLSEGPGPQRHFPDWTMAFGRVAPSELDVALGTATTPTLTDPDLLALLRLLRIATE